MKCLLSIALLAATLSAQDDLTKSQQRLSSAKQARAFMCGMTYEIKLLHPEVFATGLKNDYDKFHCDDYRKAAGF